MPACAITAKARSESGPGGTGRRGLLLTVDKPCRPGDALAMPHHYLALIAAIVTETIGTMALQASQQFTKPLPALITVLFYGASLYFMAQALRVMPVGIVYAIWSGLGIVLIAGFGFVIFGQSLDTPAMIGLALIIAGIVVIQLFSTTSPH